MAHPGCGLVGAWGHAALVARREPHHGSHVVVVALLHTFFRAEESEFAAGQLALSVPDGDNYIAVGWES